jgi:glycosyltransferase involved in cell wall biosynthesis
MRPVSDLQILRVIARLNIGGPARHVLLLERHLPARGYRTRLLFGEPHAGEQEMAIETDLDVCRVPALGRAVRPGRDLAAFWAVLREMFATQPDIVHTHTAKAGTIARIAAWIYNATRPRARRCIVVHTYHGHVFHGYFGPWISGGVRLFERQLGRITDRIITISAEQHRDVVDRYRIAPAGRVSIVPLGLDLETLAAEPRPPRPSSLRREAGFENSVVCGYVGRLTAIKNVELLFAACASAFQAHPSARLLVVGDGEDRPRLEALARERPELRGRVFFAGWRSELVDVYRAMDLVALSSRNEGTPVALIEAMAAGVPVVATKVGGVPDVIDAGRTGMLVQGDDVDAFSRALEALLEAPERRRTLAAEARVDVLRRFGYRRLLDDIDHLYRETLAAKRGRR